MIGSGSLYSAYAAREKYVGPKPAPSEIKLHLRLGQDGGCVDDRSVIIWPQARRITASGVGPMIVVVPAARR